MSSFFIDSYLNHSRSVCFLFILFCLVVCNKSCIVPAFLCGFFCFSREATHRACGVCAVCDDKDVDGNGDDEPHSQAIRHTHIRQQQSLKGSQCKKPSISSDLHSSWCCYVLFVCSLAIALWRLRHVSMAKRQQWRTKWCQLTPASFSIRAQS